MKSLRSSVLVCLATAILLSLTCSGVGVAAQKHFGRSCVDNSCAAGYDLSDVTGMSDGDTAVVPADPTYGGPLFYIWDEDSGLDESLPSVKDSDIAGNGRWILQILPVPAGGTDAATSSAARANLSAASTSHVTTHMVDGSDEFKPGESTGLTPAQVVCNEGLSFVGSSQNVGQCSAYVPNPAYGCGTTTLSADETISGDLVAEIDGGATISAYELVYVASDGDLEETNGDQAAGPLGPAIGITLASCSNGVECIILVRGCIRYNTWASGLLSGATIGGWVYMDDTQGAMSTTVNTGSGDIHQIVGQILATNIIMFDFSRPYTLVK